jgi:hypothetical protein
LSRQCTVTVYEKCMVHFLVCYEIVKYRLTGWPGVVGLTRSFGPIEA